MVQQPDVAGALGRIHREAFGQQQFGNAVAVYVRHGEVDHLLAPADDDVPLPAGILVPHQFGEPRGERDDVGLAVVVHVGDDDVVTAGESGSDGVGLKTNLGRSGECGGAGERCRGQHMQVLHTHNVTTC